MYAFCGFFHFLYCLIQCYSSNFTRMCLQEGKVDPMYKWFSPSVTTFLLLYPVCGSFWRCKSLKPPHKWLFKWDSNSGLLVWNWLGRLHSAGTLNPCAYLPDANGYNLCVWRHEGGLTKRDKLSMRTGPQHCLIGYMSPVKTLSTLNNLKYNYLNIVLWQNFDTKIFIFIVDVVDVNICKYQ